MTLAIAGLCLWTVAVALLTWLAARRKPAEPQTLRSLEAEALQANVEAQRKTLEEIAHDVQHFDLASYLNQPRKPD